MGFWLLAVNNFVVELWLHLSIIQTSLILRSVCTNLGCWLLLNENEDENRDADADENYAAEL